MLVFFNQKLEDAKNDYIRYKSELTSQWALVQQQTVNVSTVYDETIATYNDILTSFSSALEVTLRDNSLYNTLTPDTQPRNASYLLKNELATRANIKTKQTSALSVLGDTKFEISKFKVRKIQISFWSQTYLL